MNSVLKIKKVLIVDDDPNIRMLAQMSLEGMSDWTLELAESGYQALQKTAECNPDLILLDLMMPGLDGQTCFAMLQENPATRDIPVIFMTAKVQRTEVDRYLKLGVEGVITKPFDPMSLVDDIEMILSKTLRVRKL